MMRFKVGDRIRLAPTHAGYKYDNHKVFTVTKVINDTHIYYNDNKSWDFSHNLALVQPANQDAELEELARKLNEGVAAFKIANEKYCGQVEVSYDGKNFTPLQSSRTICTQYRIKSKPAFEPFMTSNGWAVRLKDDRLHIGCQGFPVKSFKTMLTHIIIDEAANYMIEGEDLQASRRGIRYRYHILFWEDADKILEALTKAGVA